MKKYNLKTDFGEFKGLTIHIDTYTASGSLAIELNTKEEPFAMLTVCLTDDIGIPYFLREGEAFVDTNNNPWAEKFIKDNGLGEPTGRVVQSGWCSYPLYRFNLKKLRA